METNKENPTSRTSKKEQAKNSSRVMKIFYLVMLVLLASSSLIGFAGAKQQPVQAVGSPTAESAPATAGTTARIFVFHRDDGVSSTCQDLTFAATGEAIYSNCGEGIEKHYSLSGVGACVRTPPHKISVFFLS